MAKYPTTDQRPRLEPWPSQGVGPGPLSPFWREVPEPELSTEPLAMLTRELKTFRAECVASVRRAEDGIMPIGHNEIGWLNPRLSEVQRLNAGLTHNRRSSRIDAWPDPVLPNRVLIGPRELIGLLGDALIALASVEEQRRVALYA